MTGLAVVIARRPVARVIVNQLAPAPPGPKGRRRRRRDSDEWVYPRLQERTQGQLGFLNNLLITLAVGVLAFAANGLNSSSELGDLGWRRWLLFSGLILLALSLLVGLWLAHNRLQSLRMTARVARLRQLRDRYKRKQQDYDRNQLEAQADFLEAWAWTSRKGWAWASRIRPRRKERCCIRRKAGNLKTEIGNLPKCQQTGGQGSDTTSAGQTSSAGPGSAEPTKGEGSQKPALAEVKAVTDATDELMKAVRKWYGEADKWTWKLLRAQTVSFVLGGALLLVVPLSY